MSIEIESSRWTVFGPIPPQFVEVYPASAKSKAGRGINGYALPGNGEAGEGCGNPVPYHCNCHGGSWWINSQCMMRECPECFEKWAAKESRIAAARVSWGSKAWRIRNAEAGDSRSIRILHAVVSFVYTGGSIDDYAHRAYEVAKAHGMIGGLKVFHPFRKDKFDHQYTTDGTVHFHLIGLAPLDVSAGRSPEEFWKVIDDEEYHDYRGFRSARAIKRAVQYLLTHCGVREGKHALTWWGAMSYRSMPRNAVESLFPRALECAPEPKPCPVCGSEKTEPCDLYDGFSKIGVHEPPAFGPDDPDPDQLAWKWLRERLSSRPIADGALFHGTDPPLEARLRAVLGYNERSHRVLRTSGRSEDEYALAPVFTLDCALLELLRVAKDEIVRDGDLRLERILETCDTDLMLEERFVFGSPVDRLRAQRMSVGL